MITPVAASDIDCPSCQSGRLVKRKAKKKGYWLGCTHYPDSTAVYWDQKGKPNLVTPQKDKVEQ